MNRLVALAAPFFALVVLSAGLGTAAAAPPRFATVKVTDIYRSLPSTLEFMKRIQADQEAIMKNERAEQLRKALTDLQELEKQLRDKSAQRTQEANVKLARDFELKRQETETLRQEFEAYREEQRKAINKTIVTEMRATLSGITAISQKIAKEKGYDGLFDSSGESNSTVPVLLYAKDAPDITEEVRAALLKKSPASPANP
ncbi:MAG: OmpH family outer membrane protein [Luteolibacter sp.]